jgi:hypothetical protein
MATSKYKLLDCNRKGILGLPSGAVHLWLCYYMHESEGQESWLSLSKLESITGLGRNKIIRWQRYLKEHGWLVETGEVAANKYTEPTVGSWQVPVVRVDDPLKGGSKIIPPEEGGSKIEPGVPKSNQCQNHTQGSSYGSKVIGSSSGSSSGSSYPSLPSRQEPSQKTGLPKTGTPQNPKTQTNTPPRARVKRAKDGTPYPLDFDSWTNVQRCNWLDEHKAELGSGLDTLDDVATKEETKPTTPCTSCGSVKPNRCCFECAPVV